MRLEAIQAELRPRAPYEAVDLGVHVLRHFAAPVWRAWLAFVLPLQALTLLTVGLLAGPGYAVLCLWWLKPAYDRVVLLVLARGLFGDPPGLAALRGALRHQGRRGLLADLSVRRLSMSRALLLPVSVLEGLGGAQANVRRRVLGFGLASASHNTLAACLMLEWVFALGLIGAGWLLLPAESDVDLATLFSTEIIFDVWAWLYVVAYAVALGAAEPLYVASGFGLYVNRRTELEGWDVELAFRRLSRRLSGLFKGAAAVLCVTLGCASSGVAQSATPHEGAAEQITPSSPEPAVGNGEVESAAEGLAGEVEDGAEELEVDGSESESLPVEESGGELVPTAETWQKPDEALQARAKAAIDAVMAREDLVRRETTTRYELKEPSEDPDMPEWVRGLMGAAGQLVPALAMILEWLLWALGIVAVVGALYFALRKVEGFERAQRAPPLPAALRTLPQEVRRVPLERIADEARALLAQGNLTRALGLLYGGSIRHFVERDGVRLGVGETEGECLGHIQAETRLGEASRDLFAHLTRDWMMAAYAHEPPSAQQVQAHCDAYQRAFPVEVRT